MAHGSRGARVDPQLKISLEKRRQRNSHLGLKIQTNPPMVVAVGPMKFTHPADCAGNISTLYP